jgi:hypothetical protein
MPRRYKNKKVTAFSVTNIAVTLIVVSLTTAAYLTVNKIVDAVQTTASQWKSSSSISANSQTCSTNVTRINNPDFFYRYGSHSSVKSFTLDNWTLSVDSSSYFEVYGNEGLASILVSPNNFTYYGQNGENGCCILEDPTSKRALGTTSATPTITIGMDKQYFISEIEWFGVKSMHYAYRNAKNVIAEGSNDNSSWTNLLSFEVPNDADWNIAEKYTLSNPGSYQYIRFRITSNWGSGTSPTKISAIYLYQNETVCN